MQRLGCIPRSNDGAGETENETENYKQLKIPRPRPIAPAHPCFFYVFFYVFFWQAVPISIWDIAQHLRYWHNPVSNAPLFFLLSFPPILALAVVLRTADIPRSLNAPSLSSPSPSSSSSFSFSLSSPSPCLLLVVLLLLYRHCSVTSSGSCGWSRSTRWTVLSLCGALVYSWLGAFFYFLFLGGPHGLHLPHGLFCVAGVTRVRVTAVEAIGCTSLRVGGQRRRRRRPFGIRP